MPGHKVRLSTLNKIEKALREIYEENPSGFVVVLSEIQRRSGVSRPTLSKTEVRDHIELCVGKFPKAYELISRQKSAKDLENQKIRAEREKLRHENKMLLSQFIDLFDRIYGESVDADKLMDCTHLDRLADGEQ